ncbi:hypothetical protein PC123_g3021 [Phytophthora cactorum]|nr:hypothetical protein PC123_g3021 [Phytophthora cactorum]
MAHATKRHARITDGPQKESIERREVVGWALDGQ